MKFNTEFEAQQYGHKIGATHYKKHDDDYFFIKAFNRAQIESDFLWLEKQNRWIPYSCDWTNSGLLSDDADVKKLKLEYN